MSTYTPADQGRCPPNSMADTPIELSGHHRRSQAISEPAWDPATAARGQTGCGLVALLRSKSDPGAGAIARLFCKRRHCPDCGPRRCARLRTKYGELLGAYLDANPAEALVAFMIASSAWASRSRTLRRHGLPYLRVPRAGGVDLVVTVASPDLDRDDLEPVDLPQLLERAFTWTPADGFDTRRPSAAGWETTRALVDQTDKPQAKASAGGAGAADPAGWDLLALVGLTYADAIAVATRRLGLDPQPVPERELPDTWAEAHQVRLPAEGTPAWRFMWRDLHCSAPPAQARELRAHRKRLRTQQDALPGLAA